MMSFGPVKAHEHDVGFAAIAQSCRFALLRQIKLGAETLNQCATVSCSKKRAFQQEKKASKWTRQKIKG